MIRRALVASVIAVAALAAGPAGPAQARACSLGSSCVTTYYSDSSQTTVVGGKYEDCDGTVSTWGTRTGYLTFSESLC
ncbi:DUF6289 family protein [Nonomuraea sp. NPDC005983]|uniref:DUF6289 family protein n=1 Tax=Nonomuraea sp. NPDC005983 TaxID=3155595 RepID=UPI0033ADD297